MGCKQKEQTPEESEIYLFFYKMMKETEFDYTIQGYDKNYEQISQLSKNQFKKLEKKQHVRIGFVKEVLKYISKVNLSEKEDHNTKKILFCTMVLTLTLKSFLKENENNYNIRSNNDMQQSLLTMAVEILIYEFKKKENLKLVIYYLAQMLVLLFKETNDISQYINIEKYIDKISYISEDNNVLTENEKYNFIKINLACIGEFFVHNYKENDLKMKYMDIIMEYFMYSFWENSSFVGKNYDIYKKEIFSENYLFNINEIILEREKENDEINLINRKKSLLSIKMVDSIISKQYSKISIKEESNISTENLVQLRRNQNYIDLNQINDNFYFFFKAIISDISSGKQLFSKYFEHIDKFATIKKENVKKKEITHFHKTNQILLLLLFAKCKINCDNVIIYSFIDFEGEFMLDNLEKKEILYEFITIFFELFKDEKDIYNRNLKLLSQIFLIEIEKLDENEKFLIEQILEKSNQLKLFISFISVLFQLLKEDEYDIESMTYSLEKINEIIDIENDKILSNKKNMIEKNMLKKEEFEILLKFINLKLKNKKTIEGKEFFNANLKFFIDFLTFIDHYFSLTEIYENISCRNVLFKKIISAITKLQMVNIEQNDNEYFNELIDFIKLFINIIKKNTLNFFVDFEIIRKFLNRNLHKIGKIKKEDISIISFKLIYSTSIFIIIQLKIIYGIPTSISNLHNEIIKEICKINNKYKEYFSDININEYLSNSYKKGSKNNNFFYTNLSKIYSDTQDNPNKMLFLTNKDFKYLINMIKKKLYGKNSPIIIYYKSQGSKIDYKKQDDDLDDFDDLIIDEERNETDTLTLSINGSNSNIFEMSLKVKKNEFLEAEDGSEENSYFSDNFSQNIILPERDEEEIFQKNNINADLDNNFKEKKLMKDLKI